MARTRLYPLPRDAFPQTVQEQVTMDPTLKHQLLMHELDETDNPYLTYETLVLRLLKRLAHACHVPWTTVLEAARCAPCLMEPDMHEALQVMWTTRRPKSVTLDEQHCVERILGRDYVRPTDLTKLAGLLSKSVEPRALYMWFAMDGYAGEDPKKYVDGFRYEREEVRGKHVRMVRWLYHHRKVETPQACRELLESIYNGTCSQEQVKDVYLKAIGEGVAEVAEWRREQQDKTKRKRGEESKEQPVAKVMVTEEMQEDA